eukprot:scaffold226093_cov31-Tisochrysis_lutea.AAC.3
MANACLGETHREPQEVGIGNTRNFDRILESEKDSLLCTLVRLQVQKVFTIERDLTTSDLCRWPERILSKHAPAARERSRLAHRLTAGDPSRATNRGPNAADAVVVAAVDMPLPCSSRSSPSALWPILTS